MEKKINFIDGGTIEEQIALMKEFFGLRPDQTFQDADVDISDYDNDEDDEADDDSEDK